jgi:hypothetical protein
VRKIVEKENPACDFRRRNGRIEHESRKRTYGPKHKKVAKVLVTRKHGYGQNHRIERAEVEGQVFYRGVPCDKVIDDSCDAGKGKHAENDYLRFLRSGLKQEVKPYSNSRTEQKRNDVCKSKSTPDHMYSP